MQLLPQKSVCGLRTGAGPYGRASDLHNNFPLPSLVVGHGGGTIRGGQHLKYEDHTPLANLLLTLMQRGGIPVESHGDSTGTFAEV